MPLGDPITQRAYFTIYENERASTEVHYENALSYIVMFDDSIRGLIPGAPVEYRGVKVGEVTRTDIDYPEIGNLLDPESRIPVMIDIIPARLGFADDYAILTEVEQRIDRLIESGLRAGLATGNLLTGRKYVELQYYDASISNLQSFAGYTVIPSFDSNLNQLLANAGNALDTINRLPLEEVAESAQNAFSQIAETLAEIQKSATELDRILADPASHQLMSTLNATLMSFQQMVLDFSEGSATNQDLQQSLDSLQRSLVELEPVLRNLRRKPNSLIFGGSDEEDPEPKGNPQ
jgi:paraquat-inducible protein B